MVKRVKDMDRTDADTHFLIRVGKRQVDVDDPEPVRDRKVDIRSDGVSLWIPLLSAGLIWTMAAGYILETTGNGDLP